MGAGKAKLQFDVTIESENGMWVARCPALGALAADPDRDTALEDIAQVSYAHLAYGVAAGVPFSSLIKRAVSRATNRVILEVSLQQILRWMKHAETGDAASAKPASLSS